MNMKNMKLPCFIAVLMHFTLCDAQWSYHGNTGPAFWSNLSAQYVACGAGTKQSPINIDTSTATVDSTLTPLTYTNYGVTQNLQLGFINTGHNIQVTPSGVAMTLSGGGLNGSYTLLEFHFHYGSTNTQGSEHTFDTVQSPMELHVSHYKTSYGNAVAATVSGASDAFAVTTFLFEISATDNPNITQIVSNLNLINGTLNATLLPVAFSVEDVFVAGLGNYYVYEGGMTTPQCFEIIKWYVYEKKLQISQSQLDAFRTVFDDQGAQVIDNFRPVQAVNLRTISKYVESEGTKPAGMAIWCLVMAVFAFASKPW